MGNFRKYTNIEFVRDLWSLVKPYKGQFFAGVFFRFTSDVGRLFPAWAISRIVQLLTEGNINQNTRELINIFLAWGLVTLYYSFTHNYCKYLGYQVAEKASIDVYKKTLAHIFRLDFSWQEKENSGNKMKRINKAQDGVNLSIRRVFNVLIEVFVNIVGIIYLFFTINKNLGISLLIYTTIFYLVGTKFLKKAIKQERIVSKAFEDLEGFTFESLNNIHTIKSLAVDKGVMNIVTNQVSKLIKKIRKRIFYYQSQFGALNTFSNLFKYFIVCYLAYGIYQGKTEIGVLVLFIGLFDKVDNSAGELTEVTQELAKAKIWLSRVKSILITKPKIEDPGVIRNQKKYNADWQKITVRNVTFSYHKKTVLDNISFTIGKGEKIGIVGLSGAGKSTLFKLFLDLYEDYYGEILLDETPLRHIKRQSYIDSVAVVLQDTELFDMSLKDNILISSVKKASSSEFLDSVIEISHLTEVVDSLPKGINTIVGEKGIKLSGGQRQRLGLARALYRNPDILLLDEATSHLDAHSEKEIQKALLESINKFTTIVIAHRLSTIKAMDKIIVLEKGKVVEEGNFEELLDRNGAFAKMWQDQKI